MQAYIGSLANVWCCFVARHAPVAADGELDLDLDDTQDTAEPTAGAAAIFVGA